MDRKGTFVVAPIYKAVGEFGDGLAAVNAGPVGFDRDNWDQQIDDIESGYYRIHQFAQFLRQFDFIGMPRSQAQALLGPPNETARDTHHESYILQSSDDGPTEAVVQYRNDKVFAYRVGAGAYWVTSNVKPDFEDALNAFSIQHGDKKAAAQSGKRRFRNF
jgi:hypothetical protein